MWFSEVVSHAFHEVPALLLSTSEARQGLIMLVTCSVTHTVEFDNAKLHPSPLLIPAYLTLAQEMTQLYQMG